ncbi:hypothetical protein [Arenibacter sp. ARW7G5Y1]|uniref:hypothetical protein n=1 Tax=Arenibacter sp. ARW7G5Y1 TaxID=2135619 RepID=UPI000D751657|nr:hypothetical protein [Arenibacter sp. ARW7G5Y1]PXX26323.1 hypothetical protein C7972_10918 [Arenibacter sp. ARW7G5Y1]
MNERFIKEIVCEAFEKAKGSCAIHSKYALSKHIGEAVHLSSKTLERAYDKYVQEKKKAKAISETSLNLLCEYLGYTNYEGYMTEKSNDEEKRKEIRSIKVRKDEEKKENGGSGKPKFPITIGVGVVFGVVLLGILYLGGRKEIRCMTWAKNHFEEISCGTKPYSKYGTDVVPYEEVKIKNFKKIEVNMATEFFSRVTHKPLIWYVKNKDGEIEYFTSPGLHPLTGKTLDEITPYIIQKYVPLHSNNKDSFVD